MKNIELKKLINQIKKDCDLEQKFNLLEELINECFFDIDVADSPEIIMPKINSPYYTKKELETLTESLKKSHKIYNGGCFRFHLSFSPHENHLFIRKFFNEYINRATSILEESARKISTKKGRPTGSVNDIIIEKLIKIHIKGINKGISKYGWESIDKIAQGNLCTFIIKIRNLYKKLGLSFFNASDKTIYDTVQKLFKKTQNDYLKNS